MRERLIHALTEAAEIEHNLLCCYLYAAFSLKAGDEGLSEKEAVAVTRWRGEILAVAVQEMAHWATVNNLLVAVGGDPHFQRPNFPVPPGYHPAGFDLRLAPFNAQTLDAFIFLERPESEGEPPEGTAPGRAVAGRDWITPVGENYRTIGEFYGAIRDMARTLAARAGPGAFVADERQVPWARLGVPGVIEIRDLAGALAALNMVIEQGEGSTRASAECHFDRFVRIRREWADLRAVNAGFSPAHAAATDPVMRRPADPSRTWVTGQEAVPLLDLANATYGALLLVLARMYSVSAVLERPGLAACAMKLMHAIARLGERLARLPAARDGAGNAGLTFAVPRNIGARGESRLLGERLCQIAGEYETLMRADTITQAARLLDGGRACAA